MLLSITPVSKPRQTQSDRWNRRPVVIKYRNFCDELRLKVGDYTMPPDPVLRFGIPMPPSWSQKKRAAMDLRGHQQKPDIDNLIKAVFDALCEDDSYIFSVRAEKYWSQEGYIELV